MLKAAAVVLITAAIMALAWYRNDLRKLTRDFAYKDQQPFNGPLYPCFIRFLLDETSTDCLLGTNSNGLFMSAIIVQPPRK